MINRMKRINKSYRMQNGIRVSYILSCLLIVSLILFFTVFSALAGESSENNHISSMEEYLADSSYSDFQKRMILNSVQDAMNDGISQEDTLSLIKNSVKNNVDPYNVKKFFDVLVSTKKEGISEKPILNKIKEGLAKNVDQRIIVNAINQKSENMLIARKLISDNEIQNGVSDEMIDVLADSLTNGVPPNVLLQVLKISNEQDKTWHEVEEITQELANLGLKAIELGIEEDNIEAIFNQAIGTEADLEKVCQNIQDLMVTAIAVKVTSGLSRDNVEGINNGIPGTDLPISSSGSILPGSGATSPSGETGSSPLSSGSSNKNNKETGSSPLD